MKNEIVWVTGAGSGIGRACALGFAAAGARVALTGRRAAPLEDAAAEITRAGGEAMVATADVADKAAVLDAHRKIVETWGDPEILLNNAGLNLSRRHWGELTPDDVDTVVGVDLNAVFYSTIAVIPAMRERKSGTLIHVASLAGVILHPVSGPSYIAAKHGVVAMSDSLNAELGIFGIRSICICPGEVETPILDTRPSPPSAADRELMLQPQDVADAALFCATLPPRACVSKLVLTPTDDNFYRPMARTIAERSAARRAG